MQFNRRQIGQNWIRTAYLAGVFLLPVYLHADDDQTPSSGDIPPVVRVISQRCIGCHWGSDAEGEVDLTRPDLIAKGPQLADDPAESVLWQRVRDDEMPPANRLTEHEKQIIQKWIAAGAPGDFGAIDPLGITTDLRAGLDWWSLKPIENPQIPTVVAQHQVRSPIDAFILRTLKSKGLKFSVQADPRHQIRRLYFDLIGLPPPPEVIQQFAKSPTDAAYQKIVDDLLDRPEYGERWARHWLDIVRFGESDGFERNAPREDAWRYRDWVIDALNQDMPYREFARRQIIGDVLCDDPVDGMAATGFLTAGVHNTVVGSSKQMQLSARQDELEDLIGVIGQTFVGMTFNCARCHDHKFDPITQQEYYQLVATLAGVNHGTRRSRSLPDQQQLDALTDRIRELEQKLDDLEAPFRKALLADRRAGKLPPPPSPQAIACWDFEDGLQDKIGQLDVTTFGDATLESGALVFDGEGGFARTESVSVELMEKTLEVWVQLEALQQRGGAAISIETSDGTVFDAIVFGEREPQMWMAGSNGFTRSSSFNGPAETARDQTVHFAITYAADGAITGYRNGVLYGKSYSSSGPHRFIADSAHVLFGLRHSPAGGNRFFSGRLIRAQLYNRALSAGEVAASAGTETDYVSESELTGSMDPTAIKRRQQLRNERRELNGIKKTLEQQSLVSIYTAQFSRPGATYFLPRGDVMNPGQEVEPKTARIFESLQPDSQWTGTAPDADRRIQLADWLTDDANPLFQRVIVNRLWHYHFGHGIIATPSDFGFNGGLPTHSQLLDFLAVQLKRNGFRLKPLHRMMVSSHAYRQSSMWQAEPGKLDSDNRWLWRKSPVRLDAEVIRDSMLAISGQLNSRQGGPGFRDVDIIDQKNGTTYYVPLDRDNDPQLNRRAIYRFSPRGGRTALLDCFDCPDPSATAPRRSVTTTPLQALSLLNNSFVMRVSREFGNRAMQEFPGQTSAQIDWMFRTTYGRPSTEKERAAASQLAESYGLSAVARALINSSEFIVIQ